MLLIKVHSFAIPMGSHGLHRSLCLFKKIFTIDEKLYNTIKCKMLCNFHILAGLGGDRGSTVVKVLCYKSVGRWFDTRWCHWNFSLT